MRRTGAPRGLKNIKNNLPSPENAALHNHMRQRGHHSKIEALLAQGAEVEGRDDLGRTPLIIATYNTDLRNSLKLLKLGADVAESDNGGDTPLHWAAYHKNKSMIKMLIKKGAALDAVNHKGDTPAKAAERMMHDCLTRGVAPITPQEAAEFQTIIALLHGAKMDKLTRPFTHGTSQPIKIYKPFTLKPRTP